jgi:hypothetical protein
MLPGNDSVPFNDEMYVVPAASFGTENPTRIEPEPGDACGVDSGDGADPGGPETIGGPEGAVRTSRSPERTMFESCAKTIDCGASGTAVAWLIGYTGKNVSGIKHDTPPIAVHEEAVNRIAPMMAAPMRNRIRNSSQTLQPAG